MTGRDAGAATFAPDVTTEVGLERSRQFAKWGEQNHPPAYWLGILVEEVGEVAKAMIEYEGREYRAELIHVAAVAIAAAESYDRNEGMRDDDG